MTSFLLPPGFRPESITVREGPHAYLGSLADGSVYKLDLRDGSGEVVFTGTGSPAGGVKLGNCGRLFVAGGFAGDGRVIDLTTGGLIASYPLTQDRPTLVADVVVAMGAAWFTDAFRPVLYRVSFDNGGQATEIALLGEVSYKEDDYNVGGIAPTPDGLGLLIAQANTGGLFRVDPATGWATSVDLQGESLTSVDGLALYGTTLYAAMGLANTVAVVRLSPDGLSGRVVRRLASDAFDVPTAAVEYEDHLFVVNAQLDGREVDPATVYTVVALPKPVEAQHD